MTDAEANAKARSLAYGTSFFQSDNLCWMQPHVQRANILPTAVHLVTANEGTKDDQYVTIYGLLNKGAPECGVHSVIPRTAQAKVSRLLSPDWAN